MSRQEQEHDDVTQRCKFCDTILVIQGRDGALMTFTKQHDDDFCKSMMRGTIEMQKKIIESQNIQHVMDQNTIMQVIRKDCKERMDLEDQLRRARCISDIAMGKTPRI